MRFCKIFVGLYLLFATLGAVRGLDPHFYVDMATPTIVGLLVVLSAIAEFVWADYKKVDSVVMDAIEFVGKGIIGILCAIFD